MNSLKVTAVASLIFFGVVTTSALEGYQQELNEYEDHPYYYGRQGQDLKSHLQANIREYQKELAEDLQEAELHRKIADGNQDRQFNKAEAEIGKAVIR